MSHWKQHPYLTFEEKTHEYRWNNSPVPSVTQIFDRIGHRKDDKSPWVPFGCPDFAKKESARTFGSAFHLIANAVMLDKKINIKNPEKMAEMQPWIDKVIRFKEAYNLIPLYDKNSVPISEYPMYSVFHKFCGTPDLIARKVDIGTIWLVEWKSSEHYQRNFGWQTAAYEILLREVFGGVVLDKREKIIRATVMFSDSRDKPKPVFRTDPMDKIAFLSLFNAYKLAA